MEQADISYLVSPLYAFGGKKIIDNGMQFTLNRGKVKELYEEIISTLKDFYKNGRFYDKGIMLIDKPKNANWKEDPKGFFTAPHQLHLNDGTKKGIVKITMKEDTRRKISKIICYQPKKKDIDYDASAEYGGRGRLIYETVEAGSKAGAFLFNNSLSPSIEKKEDETDEDKLERRTMETYQLFLFFHERNYPRARVEIPPDLREILRNN